MNGILVLSRVRRALLCGMLGSTLVVALSLAVTGVASAQTTPFQARVTFTAIRTFPGCANGAYACGTADISGYGAASWDWYAGVTSLVQTSCGTTYAATTDFTLLSAAIPSTLVLDETGIFCGPGLDANGYFRGPFGKKYGRPYSPFGAWSTVTDCSTVPPPLPWEPPCSTSTGLFAGLSGSGTDTVNIAGAHVLGTYSGIFG